MIAMINRAGKMNAGLAVSGIGWIVMAFAMLNLGINADIVQLGTLVIGFCLLAGGLALMLWAER